MVSNLNPVITIEHLNTEVQGQCLHRDLNLAVQAGEILAIVGGSGTGKSTLLRLILMLQTYSSGRITVLGKDLAQGDAAQAKWLRRHWGMLFQDGALFSALTVWENVALPLQEHTTLTAASIRELALLKILLVGLPLAAAFKYPQELSGGMQKRASLARALATDPCLLLLDEPTAGLDPESAEAFDELILRLRTALKLTVVMVTHDLDSLWKITDRVAFLGEQRVLAVAPMSELVQSEQELIKRFFAGARGRAVAQCYTAKINQ